MFKVEKIINGNTILVSPSWQMANQSGNEVVVRGYVPMFHPDVSQKWNDETENMIATEMAKSRLEKILLNAFVELRNGATETSDLIIDGKLKCRVYLNSIDISNYFPDFNK